LKLSNFITDIGRTVAYMPGLKKITHSTTATILLCQLLYWSDKATDGWIWKTADDIEEETGLTYNEQKTARSTLVALDIIEEERKRLDHCSRYRVKINVMNDLWEKQGGKKVKTTAVNVVEELESTPISDVVPVPVKEEQKLVPGQKKGDLVDGLLFFSNTPAMQKIKITDEIRAKIHMNLHVNPDNKKWEAFIEHAYKRQERFNEPFDEFIKYAIREGFSPIYWTPEKMIVMYPQAYINKEQKVRENFIERLPELKEEDYVFAPREMTKRS